ncbi:PH domain-containing protein [Parafrankia discariae]|uniref:PH domain-containing protein n=1 Tax=Parafrankia discariae TaxID=365528 RepID=UPI000373BF6B|nr:PH domain-containing protein [Parafrankia discariae]
MSGDDLSASGNSGPPRLREDIEHARRKARLRIGRSREVRYLAEHLWAGEHVERLARGSRGREGGLVVLTDRRLLFVSEGRRRRASEEFQLRNVSSVEWAAGLAFGKITVFASGGKAEITNVDRRAGREITDLILRRLGLAAPVPPAAALSSAAALSGELDLRDRLRRLGELRDAGVLTREEFEGKLARLLGPG